MRFANITTTIGLAAVTFGAFVLYRHQQALARTGSPRAPEPLQRWEDEGGNVPAANLGTADHGEPDVDDAGPAAVGEGTVPPEAGRR